MNTTPDTDLPIPEILVAFADWCIAHGVTAINKHVGCYEAQIDPQWWCAANGHTTPTQCSKGIKVPPFGVYFEFNGFPAGVVTPSGGWCAAGEAANEAALIAALAVSA